jgi:hypothetical protein
MSPPRTEGSHLPLYHQEIMRDLLGAEWTDSRDKMMLESIRADAGD